MDLKHEVMEFLKERDFGDGVAFERLRAHFKEAGDEELSSVVDELLDEELIEEIADNVFSLTGRKIGRSSP